MLMVNLLNFLLVLSYGSQLCTLQNIAKREKVVLDSGHTSGRGMDEVPKESMTPFNTPPSGVTPCSCCFLLLIGTNAALAHMVRNRHQLLHLNSAGVFSLDQPHVCIYSICLYNILYHNWLVKFAKTAKAVEPSHSHQMSQRHHLRRGFAVYMRLVEHKDDQVGSI